MTQVHLGSILTSYADGASDVDAKGATLAALFEDLDRRHPGIRFRIVDEQDRVRPHIAVFIGKKAVRALTTKVGADDVVHILGALSGG